MDNIKVAVLLVIIITVTTAGFYYFYTKQITKSQQLSGTAQQSPIVNFPSATESASPIGQEAKDGQPPQVAGSSTFPKTQPETGTGETQINGIGIQIASPQTNPQITSPVLISGTANVPNNLIVEVKDANGQILGVRKAAACFGYEACPFSISIVFSNSQTLSGQITVYSPSLSGGAPPYSQSVPVTFQNR